jgi:hypothetical protein
MRLEYNCLALANNLAYHDTATITAVKSFIVQAPDFNIIENLSSRNLRPHKRTTQRL